MVRANGLALSVGGLVIFRVRVWRNYQSKQDGHCQPIGVLSHQISRQLMVHRQLSKHRPRDAVGTCQSDSQPWDSPGLASLCRGQA